MCENNSNESSKVGIETEQDTKFSVKIQELLKMVSPDIKKWYQERFAYWGMYLGVCVVVFIIYAIATNTCNIKIEPGNQVVIINNDNGLHFLVLSLIAIIAIICPLSGKKGKRCRKLSSWNTLPVYPTLSSRRSLKRARSSMLTMKKVKPRLAIKFAL